MIARPHAVTRLAFLSLLVVSTQHAAADPLTARQLQRKLSGHTWAWTSKKFETSGVTTYFRDGRMIVMRDGSGNRPERGIWLVRENQVCVTLAGSTESCSNGMVQIDDNTLFSESTETTFVRRK